MRDAKPSLGGWSRQARRWCAAVATAAAFSGALASSPPSSWAEEPNASDKETARALMKEGDAAMRAGDAKTALERYEAASTLVDVPSTRVAVARALEKLGRLIEARNVALAVTRTPAAPDEPKAFTKARAEASELAKAVLPRIASVKIQLEGKVPERGLRAEIDGKPIQASVITVTRRLDPGEHQIMVTATGYEPKTVTVTLAEGEKKVLPIELQERWSDGGAPPPVVDPETDTDESSEGSLSPLVPIGFGVAGAGAIFGAITGVVSLGKTSDAEAQCVDGRCPASAQGDLDDAQTMATLSNVGFIVTAVGLGVGVVGIFLSGGSSDSGSAGDAAVSIEPMVGVGSVGMRGAF